MGSDNVAYVHGSPRNPLNEFLFPEDLFNVKKMEECLQLMPEALCFCGHTHIPGLFLRPPADSWTSLTPADCNFEYTPKGVRVICNAGSVGQPRDRDTRASYVLYDGESLRFRRVEYDVRKTAEKLYAIPEVDRFQGERLLEGW